MNETGEVVVYLKNKFGVISPIDNQRMAARFLKSKDFSEVSREEYLASIPKKEDEKKDDTEVTPLEAITKRVKKLKGDDVKKELAELGVEFSNDLKVPELRELLISEIEAELADEAE